MNEKQIDHYICIVPHPPNHAVEDIFWPSPTEISIQRFHPKDYPLLWEPVYKKEPLCFLPDEHGKMQAMYHDDNFWACFKHNREVIRYNVVANHPKEDDSVFRFATKAAAEAKALELNKVEHDNEKVYTRGEMEEARELLDKTKEILPFYFNELSASIDAFLKQPIK